MKAPKIPSFLRQNQYNTYTPRYRYYDPAKERREQREKLYGKNKNDDSSEDGTPSLYIKDNLRSRIDRVRHVKKSGEGSSARTLIIIIMILLAGIMWMLQTDWFERLITSFIKI